MSVRRFIYTALLYTLTPFALLRLVWRARRQPDYLRHVVERFGSYAAAPNKPVIWIHAVSVGETRAAEPLVKALNRTYPDHQILLTHMTPTGRQTGEQLFGDAVLRCYLPYDLPFAVSGFLRHFRPRFGVLMETELWPNLVHGSRVAGVSLFLVNARLSERSARGYGRLGRLTLDTLRCLAAIGAQSEADAARLRALGATRVTVTGNLKFDRGPKREDEELGSRLRGWFGNRPVFLAASTRDGEEELVLDAVEGVVPDLLTVIVPRHPQRFEDLAQLLERRRIPFQRRSEASPVGADTKVVVGDSMGELFAYYMACDVAYVGGSLLPLGGQNLLEACAVGKPVVVGPHTFNFEEATRLALDTGAAVQVDDVAGLAGSLKELLEDPARRQRMGQTGLALMRKHQGATERTVELLKAATALSSAQAAHRA